MIVTDHAAIPNLTWTEKWIIKLELGKNVEGLNVWHEPVPSDKLALWTIRDCASWRNVGDVRFHEFETTMDEYESNLYLTLVANQVRSLRKELGLW